MRSFRGAVLWLALFGSAVNLLLLGSPLYMMHIYDRVLTSGSVPTLVAISIGLAVVYVAYALAEVARGALMVRVSNRFDADIARRVFASVFEWTPDRAPERLLALRNLEAVRQFLTSPMVPALFDLPFGLVFLAVAALLHPWFLYLGLAAILLSILTALGTMATTGPRQRRAGMAIAQANRMAESAFARRDPVVSMGMQRPLQAYWTERHEAGIAEAAGATTYSVTFTAASKAIRLGVQSAVLGVGAYLVILEQMSPGGMIAASILLGRAVQPIDQVIAGWAGIGQASAAWRTLKQTSLGEQRQAARVAVSDLKGEVRCEKLMVPKGGGGAILAGIDFALPAGSILVVSGANGSGKTTLLRVLAGIHPAPTGHVLLDGYNVDHVDPGDRARLIGFVPQSADLFEGTIAENIARFDPDRDDEAVVRAARMAGVIAFAAGMEDGLATPLQATGAPLSSGQAFAVAFARALYARPAIMLLDEPQANLDSEADLRLLATLADLKKDGTTVILASHKDTGFVIADYILFLNQGRQMVYGRRDEVLREARERIRSAEPVMGGRRA